MSDILSKYDTSLDGLDQNEAQKRQEKYGLNEIIEKKPTPLIVLFLSQFVDILIGLLVIMGFIQEKKKKKAVESLKGLITKHVIVKRNNQVHEIDAKLLTVGDIVILEEGCKVPADLVLIEAHNLSCDESQLTGESESVKKDTNDNVYMDSNIISGNAKGVVAHVGMDTELGKIAGVIQEDDEETPLAKRVGKLGKILSAIAIVVCIAIFILELFKGVPLVETFMTAVSLAVALISVSPTPTIVTSPVVLFIITTLVFDEE